MSYQIPIEVNGHPVVTLADILPAAGPMRMLIVGKTPASVSVESGHYFQGQQGTMLWKGLQRAGILHVPADVQPDDVLLQHGYGITDLVKMPHSFGVEPSISEYQACINRLRDTIDRLAPRVLCFVYKGVLDRLLALHFNHQEKSKYGFNPNLDQYFASRVFVFPMPGTPCTKSVAERAMEELATYLSPYSSTHR